MIDKQVDLWVKLYQCW